MDIFSFMNMQVKHRVHPDYAGRINLPPSNGLFADSAAGSGGLWPAPEAPEATSAEDKEEEDAEEAFWRVGVVATSHLLNSTSAAR